MHYGIISLIFLGGIIFTVGDIFMKYWIENKGMSFYLFGMCFWVLGLMLLAQSLSYNFKNIVTASVSIILINMISLSLVYWFVFHEKFSVYQIIGIVLGLVAIALLDMSLLK